MSIRIEELSYEHSNRELLFENINLYIESGKKAALIGNNGTGKSTLLRIIGDKLPIKSGIVDTATKAYYVPQHLGQYDDKSIAQALQIGDKVKAMHAILAGDATESNFELLADDWEIENKALFALAEWGLENRNLQEKMINLSGGEKTKVFLAGITIHNPSIILLDEPTNHLDYHARDKLYEWVENTQATLLLVSHDRALLNLLSDTYELSGLGLNHYAGNYDFYQEQKEIETSSLLTQLENKGKELREIKKTQQKVAERRQRLDARGRQKGVKMGLGLLELKERQNRAERSTSKLQGTHGDKLTEVNKNINQIQANIEERRVLKMNFDTSDLHQGKILVEAKKINFKYEDTNLWTSDLDFRFCSGQRILIKGSNGSGKTTLLKLITQQMKATSGKLHLADFNYLHLDQDYSIINNKLSVYEQVQEYNIKMPEHEIKMNLARSQFPSHTWDRICANLSGGEKMKLVLCCLIVSESVPDMIILDEPTNNIDLYSMQVLTNSIKDYKGGILLVSHDKKFISEIGIDDIIEIG